MKLSLTMQRTSGKIAQSEQNNIELYYVSFRDFFAHDGTCSIVNNWNETIMTDGQKVVRYTVVLKFDDQMVANSVKQKLVHFNSVTSPNSFCIWMGL